MRNSELKPTKRQNWPKGALLIEKGCKGFAKKMPFASWRHAIASWRLFCMTKTVYACVRVVSYQNAAKHEQRKDPEVRASEVSLLSSSMRARAREAVAARGRIAAASQAATHAACELRKYCHASENSGRTGSPRAGDK